MALASTVPGITVPMNGFFDTIFRQTSLTIRILGYPKGGFTINLIQLLIITVLAIAVNAIAERLTTKKVGGLFTAVLITILGIYLIEAFVHLPFDFAIEGVRILAALIGAIIIAVFYTLIRAQTSGGGSGAKH
ncbi:MAG TPA: hypothetical protein VKQ36_05220 [Ktedonobacterales bacterium]|nr:hypothetical protein [Ktedonobacterales bacterium]